MVTPVAAPPSSGAARVKHVKFRCLMVALTAVVSCLMVFNVVWLFTLLERDGPLLLPTPIWSRRSSPKAAADAEYHAYNPQQLLLQHEVHPQCDMRRPRRTVQDVQACFPTTTRSLPPDCRTIHDWPTVQRCLTGRYRNDTAVRHVHIVGERHSGTKFLTNELQACFPRHTRYSFRVHRDFVRSKHFFQPLLWAADLEASWVVVVVRDPVDWLAAMREKPYHSPAHVAGWNETSVVPLSWYDFLQRSWTLPNVDAWETHGENIPPNNQLCQDNFRRHEVVPCSYNASSGQLGDRWTRGFAPVYELQRDHSGQPFASIVQLRTEKLVNFVLEIPLVMSSSLAGLLIVRYEDVLQNGTRFVLDQLGDLLDVSTAQCRATPPQPNRGRRVVPADVRAYLRTHLDANVERLVGYDLNENG